MIQFFVKNFIFLLFVLFYTLFTVCLRSGFRLVSSDSFSIDELSRLSEQLNVNLFYFQLDKIEGLERVNSEKLLAAVGLAEGMEIESHKRGLLLNYLSTYPWIESYSVTSEILPKRMKIFVKEAVPAFVLEKDGQTWLLSNKGLLIEPLSSLNNKELILESSSLPRLFGYDANDISQERTSLASTSLKLQTTFKTLEYFDLAGGLPFEYVTITILPYGELLFEVKNGHPTKEVILTAHDLEEARIKLSQLRGIYKDLENKNELANQIDLRFKSQGVVR
jgi:hypothetical protein